jgi:hypothetical protein
MKPIFAIFLSLLFTSCLKANIAPVSAGDKTATKKTDSLQTTIGVTQNPVQVVTPQVAPSNTYDWYNGTKGTALIQVTCKDCSAIATIGDVTIPFLFNEQGVGLLKYTPMLGLAIRIAVCPESVKTIKAEIFDTANASLYAYSGVNGNWNGTYIIK